MVYKEVNTSESFVKSDFFFHHKVSTLTFECFVRLLGADDKDITSFLTWIFISLAMESVNAAIRTTFVNANFNNFLFLDNLLTIAFFALVLSIDHLALTTAVIARSRALGVHTRSDHLHLSHHASAFASRTSLHSSFFATFTVTLSANALSVDCNFGLLAIVDILESHRHLVLDRLTLLGSLRFTATHAAHTSEDATEKIFHIVTTTATFFESISSILVINVSLFFVTENLVGTLNLLELVFVTTAIRMLLHSLLSVGFLDFVITCSLLNTENLIELRVFNFSLRSTSAAHATRHLLKISEWESSLTTKEHIIG
mmetsp:Transcript_46596/g.63253  ORF Transcript_46596/g.63253 Transcript_46596/m.63253 type:complete len:314 (+) Transcript_46596:425-1366(+)